MKARALIILALFALTGTAAFAVRGCAQQTRLPSATRALLETASMEPIELALVAHRLSTTREERHDPSPYIQVVNRLVLRVPAAYVDNIGFHPQGPDTTRIVLLFWSRSFDPVRPDREADDAACRPGEVRRPCAALGPQGGRESVRQRDGEFPVRVTVVNQPGNEDARLYGIRRQAGVVRGLGRSRGEPCEFREDPVLGMLVGRPPEGGSVSACDIGGHRMLHTPTGRTFGSANFLKREADGTPRFGVRCAVYTSREDNVGASLCTMTGYFGIWPLQIHIRSDRADEWDAIFVRLRAFLAQHTVSRTD